MATKEAIIKPIDPEIVPKTELKGIETALYDLAVKKAELPIIKQKLEALTITDAETYRKVGELVQQARAVSKQGELSLNPFKAIVNRAKETLQGWLNAHEEEAKVVADIGAAKQAAWNKKEREEAAAEERRKQQEKIDEQNRRAELQRKADEEAAAERKERRIGEIREMLKSKTIGKREAERLLREAGAKEEADKAKAAADAEETASKVPEVKVAPIKATVAGQRARAPWVWEMVDIEKIPRELLYPLPSDDGTYKVSDFPRITKMVKETKDKAQAEAKACGGITAYQDDRV
jgi:hypothetical protein